jgi:hypothetical protein
VPKAIGNKKPTKFEGRSSGLKTGPIRGRGYVEGKVISCAGRGGRVTGGVAVAGNEPVEVAGVESQEIGFEFGEGGEGER